MATQPKGSMLLQLCRCIRNIANALIDSRPENRIVFRHFASATSEIFLDPLPVEGKQRLIALLNKTGSHTAACLS